MYLAVQKFSGPSHTLKGNHFFRNTYYFRNIALMNLSKQLTLAWLRQVYPFAEWEIASVVFKAPDFILSFAYSIKNEFAAACAKCKGTKKYDGQCYTCPAGRWIPVDSSGSSYKAVFAATLEGYKGVKSSFKQRHGSDWPPDISMSDYFRNSWTNTMHSHFVINSNLFMFTLRKPDEAFAAGPKNYPLTTFIYPVSSKLVSRHWSLFAKKHASALAVLNTYASC